MQQTGNNTAPLWATEVQKESGYTATFSKLNQWQRKTSPVYPLHTWKHHVNVWSVIWHVYSDFGLPPKSISVPTLLNLCLPGCFKIWFPWIKHLRFDYTLSCLWSDHPFLFQHFHPFTLPPSPLSPLPSYFLYYHSVKSQLLTVQKLQIAQKGVLLFSFCRSRVLFIFFPSSLAAFVSL